ncbi:DnaJ-domain-containing protein [Artomyces pyxidatus]|uniref:DnaJ-domain-containing protein n=1 Tax=Artomyces pyxidatus TaxID=48021 RepID=A0ACB8TG55_9AGAM|nr:DnaJ-domain-containing protein [Artomyces pyxidatus]
MCESWTYSIPLAVPVETDLYDLLGLPAHASEGDIKKAYRKKAKDLHPDKNPNDSEAIQNFQEMAAAYEILSDPDSREVYDTYGMEGLSGHGGGRGGPPDMDHVFAQFFGMDPGGGGGMGGGMPFGFDFGGGGGPGNFRKRTKGEDSVIPYEVSLEDLYNGKSVKMMMEKEIECGTCKGSGARGSGKPKKCAACEGKGWTHVQTQIAPGRLGTTRAQCGECHGAGEKLREKDRCKKCKGEKTVSEKTRQEIYVEKGMSDGQRIVLAGAGDQEPGLPAGDVIFVLKALPHPSLQRSGNDLLAKVKITLSEALLGFDRILVNHLDGRGLRVASPPRKIIKTGQTIVLRGEGMPTYRNPDDRGNLYVVLEVEMPEEEWLDTIDTQVLETLLPAKKADVEPKPSVVDDARYEESDLLEVRSQSFPAGSDFFDQGLGFQFGEGADEGAWEDEDEDEGGEPECRTQ